MIITNKYINLSSDNYNTKKVKKGAESSPLKEVLVKLYVE